MNELKEIKARAVKRRRPDLPTPKHKWLWEQAEADLDRAIAILEGWSIVIAETDQIARADQLEAERDEARAELAAVRETVKRWAENAQPIYEARVQELEDAHAAVLMLRDMLVALQPINMDNEGCLCVTHKDCEICRALDVLWKWNSADTESYEQYR